MEIGDKVRVKSEAQIVHTLDENEELHDVGIYFDECEDYFGQDATITDVYSKDGYTLYGLDIDNGEDYWCEEWLTPIRGVYTKHKRASATTIEVGDIIEMNSKAKYHITCRGTRWEVRSILKNRYLVGLAPESFYVKKEHVFLHKKKVSLARDITAGEKDKEGDKDMNDEKIAEKLELKIVGTIGTKVILEDGRVGHFECEPVRLTLTAKEQMKVAKMLPAPIGDRYFSAKDCTYEVESYVFVEIKSEEKDE